MANRLEKEIVAHEAEMRRHKKAIGEIVRREWKPIQFSKEMKDALERAKSINVLPSRWVK